MAELYIISKHQGKVFRGVETYVEELSKRSSATILNSPHHVIVKKSGSVIISTGGRWESIFLRLVTWLKGQKLIIPGQSGLGFDDRLNLYCFPDAFVALTHHQAEWARKVNPFVKVTVIPNGVDLAKFSPSVKPMNLNLPKPIIFTLGAFFKEKRHELLINAVTKLNASLFIAGSPGPDKQRIETLGHQKLPGKFGTGYFNRNDIPKVFSSADLFVYMTVPWESFGIAILEAMATNLPIVATDDPIRREIVGDAGLFATPKNLSREIAKALQKNWGNLPRLQAKKFSWDIVAQKYMNLIKNL